MSSQFTPTPVRAPAPGSDPVDPAPEQPHVPAENGHPPDPEKRLLPVRRWPPVPYFQADGIAGKAARVVRARRAVGVTVEPGRVILAIGKPGRNTLQAHLATEQIPHAATDGDGHILDKQAVTEALRALVDRNGLRHCRAIAALPNPGVKARHHPMPGTLNDKALEASVLGTVHAPERDTANLHVDMMITRVAQDGQRVVLAASADPKAAIDLADAVQTAGLALKDVEPGFCCTARVIRDEGDPCLVVEVSAEHTTLINVVGGVPQAMSTVPIGMLHMSDITVETEAARIASEEFEDAARYQTLSGGYARRDELLEQITRVANATNRGPEPRILALCGEGAWGHGLSQALSDETGRKVTWPAAGPRLSVSQSNLMRCPAALGAMLAARFGGNVTPQKDQAS